MQGKGFEQQVSHNLTIIHVILPISLPVYSVRFSFFLNNFQISYMSIIMDWL